VLSGLAWIVLVAPFEIAQGIATTLIAGGKWTTMRARTAWQRSQNEQEEPQSRAARRRWERDVEKQKKEDGGQKVGHFHLFPSLGGASDDRARAENSCLNRAALYIFGITLASVLHLLLLFWVSLGWCGYTSVAIFRWYCVGWVAMNVVVVYR
jgi:hypothetical protein